MQIVDSRRVHALITRSQGLWLALAVLLLACSDIVVSPIHRRTDKPHDAGPKEDAAVSAFDAGSLQPVPSGTDSGVDARIRRPPGGPFGPDVPANDVPTSAHCRPAAPAAGWTSEQVAVESMLVDAINMIRTSPNLSCGGQAPRNPLQAFRAAAELRCSARLHSMDMANRDYFSLNDPETGETPQARMVAAGLTAPNRQWDWDESIARRTSVTELTTWLRDNKCNTLANPRLTLIGVGFYQGFWTVDFAGQ